MLHVIQIFLKLLNTFTLTHFIDIDKINLCIFKYKLVKIKPRKVKDGAKGYFLMRMVALEKLVVTTFYIFIIKFHNKKLAPFSQVNTG